MSKKSKKEQKRLEKELAKRIEQESNQTVVVRTVEEVEAEKAAKENERPIRLDTLDKYGDINYNLTESGLRLFYIKWGFKNELTFISEQHPAYRFVFMDQDTPSIEIEKKVITDYLEWSQENEAALEKYVY